MGEGRTMQEQLSRETSGTVAEEFSEHSNETKTVVKNLDNLREIEGFLDTGLRRYDTVFYGQYYFWKFRGDTSGGRALIMLLNPYFFVSGDPEFDWSQYLDD